MSARFIAALFLWLALFTSFACAQSPNLAVNPGFEDPLSIGWTSFWEREAGTTSMAVSGDAHSGALCLEIGHTGEEDWCVSQQSLLAVAPGDIFELSGWIKCDGIAGEVNYSVVTRDGEGNVIDWVFGPALTSGTHGWEQVKTHFIAPENCATIHLRIVGWGPGAAWFDDVSLLKEGNINDIRGPAEDLVLENAALRAVFNTGSSRFALTDLRNGAVYQQLPLSDLPAVLSAHVDATTRALTATLWEPASDAMLSLTCTVPEVEAELRCELSATGPMVSRLGFPAPFAAPDGTFLVLPLNEGILFPADDETVDPLWLVTYSGHGICMPWFGQCQGEQGPGVMAILETPDNGWLCLDRPTVAGNVNLTLRPQWEPSRGEFAYPRVIRYVLTADGGYVSQAKRYRAHAQEVGLFKTLLEKRERNPNVDLLIGAVNVWAPVWYGNTDPVGLIREMQSLGVNRILSSEGASPQAVTELNALPGVLTSRYDNYQDVWPPDAPTWATHEGWPEDLVWQEDGSLLEGWVIRDGENLWPGGVVCSPRGFEHAQEQIPADLATTPYRSRFLDTTTATILHECYHPDHPTTRSDDKYWKSRLLGYCSEDLQLVTGSETGIDWSVPYVHYYEGMMSLGPYRLPDCGYTLIDYVEPTPEFLKYQVGPYYRIPLWELVYHDCTVSYWYWGDSTNKAPEVWDQRDLYNLLYGTPPLFMLSPEVWSEHQARFVQSYQNVNPIARAVGYDELLSHEFLTEDHTLQRTFWSSGLIVTVNFANYAQELPEGGSLAALDFHVQGYRFSDVPPSHWAFSYVEACAAAGIVGGYDDGTYRPAQNVTRDQMAVFISRALAGGDELVPTGPAIASFTDVLAEHWAFRYVEYAVENGVVAGYPDGTYRPSLTVTRDQMAVFISRTMVGGDEYVPTGPATPAFVDVPTNNWAFKYIEYLRNEGVVGGYPDGTYRPLLAVTRDQMAVYIQRAFDLPR